MCDQQFTFFTEIVILCMRRLVSVRPQTKEKSSYQNIDAFLVCLDLDSNQMPL